MINQGTKKYIIVIFMLLFIGCNGRDDNYDTMRLKQFLFLNSHITIQLDGGDKINKYTANNYVSSLGRILTINEDSYELQLDEIKSNIGRLRPTIFPEDAELLDREYRLLVETKNQFNIDEVGKKYEILITKSWQKIGGILNEKYYVRGGSGYTCDGLMFGTRKPKINKKKEKEDFEMDLSLGTWISIIIVMVIISKIAHKISLKTIFKPTKQAVKHVEKEWKES